MCLLTVVAPVNQVFPQEMFVEHGIRCGEYRRYFVKTNLDCVINNPWILDCIEDAFDTSPAILQLTLANNPSIEWVCNLLLSRDERVRQGAEKQFLERMAEADYNCLSLAIWLTSNTLLARTVADALKQKISITT